MYYVNYTGKNCKNDISWMRRCQLHPERCIDRCLFKLFIANSFATPIFIRKGVILTKTAENHVSLRGSLCAQTSNWTGMWPYVITGETLST